MPTPVGRRENACYADDENELASHWEPGLPEDRATPESTRVTIAGALGTSPHRAEDGECDLIPDYVTLGAGARAGLSLGDSYTIDRYGNRYGSVVVGFATPGPSVSSMAGYLRDDAHPCVPPTEEKLESFLTGVSRNEMSAFGVAAGLTTSNGITAREFGVGTPGASITMAYGWMVHDERHGRERR